jgi:intracellular sulfur oxidation DsrE/DsrF family protein
MKRLSLTNVVLASLFAALASANPVWAAQTEPAADAIHVDVPVVMKQAKVVYNMDHAAFAGDTPVGLGHMTMMVKRFKDVGTEWKIAGIFHGEAGYMLLNDETYNKARKTKSGNPYKGMIENLIKEGVDIEECAVTMKGNGWTNAELLPGVKVNSGADGRIVQLVQEGYVMLQP